MRLFILSITLFFSVLQAADYEYIVAESLLQERMKQEFPIVKKTMFLTFSISEPKLDLDGKKQRFNFTARLKVPNIQDTNGKVASALVSVSSRIAYSKGGKLYLRKIKVVDIQSDFIGENMKSMLYPSLNTALNEYFNAEPVYSLEKEAGIIGAAVKSIKNVVIVNEGIKVVFGMGL